MIVPPVGFARPETQRSRVVFPPPLLPITARISRSATSRSIPLRISRPPKACRSPSTRIKTPSPPRRSDVGLTENRWAKARLKWDKAEKPTALATVPTGRPCSTSIRRAFSSRRLTRYLWNGWPVACLKRKRKWDVLRPSCWATAASVRSLAKLRSTRVRARSTRWAEGPIGLAKARGGDVLRDAAGGLGHVAGVPKGVKLARRVQGRAVERAVAARLQHRRRNHREEGQGLPPRVVQVVGGLQGGRKLVQGAVEPHPVAHSDDRARPPPARCPRHDPQRDSPAAGRSPPARRRRRSSTDRSSPGTSAGRPAGSAGTSIVSRSTRRHSPSISTVPTIFRSVPSPFSPSMGVHRQRIAVMPPVDQLDAHRDVAALL